MGKVLGLVVYSHLRDLIKRCFRNLHLVSTPQTFCLISVLYMIFIVSADTPESPSSTFSFHSPSRYCSEVKNP